MFIVALKIEGGGLFTVRCRDIVKDSVVPGNVVLIRCLDPIPTQWGKLETEAWSISPSDIANYMQGEVLLEKKQEKESPHEKKEQKEEEKQQKSEQLSE
jgi:hypothetical protein